MTMLLIGGTGQVGSSVAKALAADHDARIQVVATNPERARMPAGVEEIGGAVRDIGTVRGVMKDIAAEIAIAHRSFAAGTPAARGDG